MTRREFQRAQVIRDGRKAIELIDSGLSIPDILLIIGGSRNRLYVCMRAAQSATSPTPAPQTKRRASDRSDASAPTATDPAIDPLFL